MMKAVLSTVAIAAVLAVPMSAQTAGQAPARGAPISKGVTTGDLASQVEQVRQQSSDLLIKVNRLEDQVNVLNGRIESLEFELGRVRQTNEDLLTDNDTLGRDSLAMRQQLDRQARAIAAMQALLGLEPEPVADTSGYLPQSFASAPSSSAGRGIDSSGPSQLGPSGSLPEGSLGTLPASQLPGEAGPLFAEAKARFLRLDYAGAEEAYRAFIDKFGKDPQAAEAYFWLGEALHQQNAWAESGQAYTAMIRSYPDDVRAPDAFVRLARSMRLLGEPAKACQALDTLPSRYPNASKVVRDLAAVERTRSGCKN
jgi:tol-pal system protein YbgF